MVSGGERGRGMSLPQSRPVADEYEDLVGELPVRSGGRAINLSQADLIGRYQHYYGFLLLGVFTGYLLMNKGFAYLHLNLGFPLYIGEIALALGMVPLLRHSLRLVTRSLSEPVFFLHLTFMTLGVTGTLPMLGAYGLDAVRDSAVYYYSLFMLIVYLLLRGGSRLEKVIDWYGRIIPFFVFWFFLLYWTDNLYSQFIPKSSAAENISIFYLKSGDMKVHLAGMMVFMFLMRHRMNHPLLRNRALRLIWPVFAFTCFFLDGFNRAPFLALVGALGLMLLKFRRRARILGPVFLAGWLILAGALLNPRIVTKTDKEISLEVALGLIHSLWSSSSDPRMRSGTAEWRLQWWGQIIDDTVYGDYFWTGRGFGPNLADVHGFQVNERDGEPKLRSPHNFHLMLLARMGVPGLAAWLLLLFFLYLKFGRGIRRARYTGDRLKEVLLIWVIAYGAAFLINGAFNVSLEGPAAAICFWGLLGLGLAACERRFRPGPAGNGDRPEQYRDQPRPGLVPAPEN